MSRRFGVELEVLGGDHYREDVAEAMSDAGLPTRVEGYNHDERQHWKVVTDASLAGTNPMEVVSPVLERWPGVDEVRRAVNTLDALGCRVNRTCGYHVHIDAGELRLDDLKNLIALYATLEPAIDAVMPKSRRGRQNIYCRSVRQYLWPVAGDMTQREQGVGSLKPGLKKLAEATSVDRLHQLMRWGASNTRGRLCHERFCKLNLDALLRHGTVEFRQHSGTLSEVKALAWLDFCQNAVDRAVEGYVPKRGTHRDLLDVASPTYREYWNERRRTFEVEPLAESGYAMVTA
jgi:hypothetical protein